MRFFEEQEKARAQTRRLLLLFGLAVIALVLAVNGALALTWRLVSPGWNGYPAYFFSVNTAVTLLFVLGGWWLETSVLQGGGEALARQVGAREAWRGLADLRLLRRYERARQGEWLRMRLATDGLQLLFGQPGPLAGALRNWGMTLFEHSGPLKSRIAKLAMGTV